MSPAHICATCGQSHEGIDFSFAADSPDSYANLSPDQRDTRAILTTDHCIIDQRTFFLRGCLEIPIIGHSEPFLWGLWAIVWEKDFDEIDGCWESSGREKTHGPFKVEAFTRRLSRVPKSRAQPREQAGKFSKGLSRNAQPKIENRAGCPIQSLP